MPFSARADCVLLWGKLGSISHTSFRVTKTNDYSAERRGIYN